MIKNRTIAPWALVFVTIGVLLFHACRKADSNMTNNENESVVLITADELGRIHNCFLTHFKNEFVTNPTLSTIEEGLDYITSFYTDFANTLELGDEEKDALIESLIDYKRFLSTNQFYNELYINNIKNDNDSTGMYFSAARQANNLGILDDFEYNKLEFIGQIVKDNYNGLLSNEELKVLIKKIDEERIHHYTNTNSGQVLAYTIAVAFASIEWWEENPDAFGDNGSSKALPAWAAADIVGAAYSSIVSGVGSYTTTGSVNWGAVGIAAAGGAIAGSTGIIGKASKWLTTLL